MKILYLILAFLFAILVIFSLLLSQIYGNFYHYEFKKLKVDSKLEGGADLIYKNILDFFENKSELLNIYDKRETAHMQDVKNAIFIIKNISLCLLFSLIIILGALASFGQKVKIRDLVKTAGIILIIMTTCIALLALISFNLGFTLMHNIFFEKDSWTFSSGVLISIFPEKWFFDFTLELIFKIFIFASVLLILGYLPKKR